MLRATSDAAAGLWDESEALLAAANRGEAAADDLDGRFEALESRATFDHVLFDGAAFGMFAEPQSEDEHDYLGLPGLLEADQVSTLLRERQRRQQTRHEQRLKRDAKAAREPVEAVALHRVLADRRKLLNSLVAQHARATGVPHSHVHADLRRQSGGPKLAECSVGQIEERIVLLRGLMGG